MLHDTAQIVTDPQEILTHLGSTVLGLRKARGWARRELAARAGISQRFLADIESGRANPSVLRLCELARALGTTPTTLLARPEVGLGAVSRHVALLGLRGAGKSTVGAALARRLGCDFVELDALVEATAGLSLTEMFQVHGEAYYRRTEGEVLEQVLDRDEPLVLATGGGLVTAPHSFDVLKARAHCVWLRADPQDHWTRVIAQGDTRPMADNEQAYSDLCAILAEREQLYRQAQLIVHTSGRSVDEVTAELGTHFAFLAEPSAAGPA